MEKTKLPKNRIQMACKELEEALSNFENDESGKELELERQKRLREIKIQLVAIKSQLEDLS